MAVSGYKEIKKSLDSISERQINHGEQLATISQHLKDLNGKVVTNRNDIDELFGIQNKCSSTMLRYVNEFKTETNETISTWKGVTIGVGATVGILGTIIGIIVYVL